MDRSLSVERTYSLGQYQNIKLFDSIGNLPEEVIFNSELINEIRFLQLVQLETHFREYVKLYEKLHTMNTEEARGYLEEIKLNTLDEIEKLFKQGEK